MLRRVPSDLPLFAASLFGLSFMAFGFTAMYTEGAVGRPSSTASLGFFFVPIWRVLAAVAGLVLGFIVRAVWRRARGSDAESNTSALLAILAFAVVSAAGAGAWNVIQYEQGAKPRIRFDSGLVVREVRADSERAVRASTTLYDSDKSAMLSWGSNRSELFVADDQVVLRDTATGKNAQFVTGTLDYITRVDAVPLASMRGDVSLLAVVICDRATGRRAIVAVIDENYKIVYEEQVERFWELGATPVEVRVGAGSGMAEYAVVGPASYESLILKPAPQR